MRSSERGGPVKVLYMLGLGRSGTTVLDLLLGGVNRFFSVGELQSLWKESIGEGRLCGCGKPVARCPVWTSVLRCSDIPPSGDVVRLQQQLAIHGGRVPRSAPASEPATRYRAVLGQLYQAIAGETGARVIVDSSKLPAVAALLERTPGIQPFLLQVVRDPRAVAYSWGRKKYAEDRLSPQQMERFSAVATARMWMSRHIASERIRRRSSAPGLIVRYEDLVVDPRRVVERIADHVDEPADLSFIGDGRLARMAPNHTVSGNPVRLRSGSIEIREDGEWVTRMPQLAFAAVTAVTAPLLLHYGYGFARPRAAIPTRRGQRAQRDA